VVRLSETATITVKAIELDGEFHRLVDGNDVTYATKKDDVLPSGDLVGKQVEIEFKVYKKTKGDRTYTNRYLEAVKVLGNGDTPPLGTGEYVTGQKPAIEARRIGASTAAHVAAQLTNAFLAHRNPGVEVTPDYVRSVYDAMESHVYVQLARRGEYLGEPPF
jgi:hypothetical protein